MPTPSQPHWADNFGHDEFGVFADWRLDGVVQRFRWISPGEFVMGSPRDEPGRYANEGPQHVVVVPRGFWLADTPVTQELWAACGGTNRSHFSSARRPVESVSWDEVSQWVARLNEAAKGANGDRSGWAESPLRLPAEAEWEYACRAGTSSAIYAGPMDIRDGFDCPELNAIAWYGGNSDVAWDLPDQGMHPRAWHAPPVNDATARGGTRRVKEKAPNAWGLFDMLGNVWEWCADPLREYSAATWTVEESLPGPAPASGHDEQCLARVIRGGSWTNLARDIRAASRYDYSPESAHDYLGFRLARSAGR